MDFEYSELEETFRSQVRSWLKEQLNPYLEAEMEAWSYGRAPADGPGPHLRQFVLNLGAMGWLGMDWPQAYGGQGRSLIEQFIVYEELISHRAILPNFEALMMVGPTILRYGTEDQKRHYLPRIARGEIEFALGYTEPQAGSDVAALEMRAVEDVGNYVISGQKMFNTCCHYADYHWLAARTDFSVPKHRGISLFIVDLKSPGITIRPLWTMAGGRTNEVFYDDVRVPKENLVGEKNRGWSYMLAALDYERVVGFGFSITEAQTTFYELVQYVTMTKRGRTILAKNPLVRHKLAKLAIKLRGGWLLRRQTTWNLDNGIPLSYETEALKIFATETSQQLVDAAMEILGPLGQLRQSSKWAPLQGRIETGYRACVMYTFGGGSSELMRNLVAIKGLGLPIM